MSRVLGRRGSGGWFRVWRLRQEVVPDDGEIWYATDSKGREYQVSSLSWTGTIKAGVALVIHCVIQYAVE